MLCHEVNISINHPILQLRKLRHRERPSNLPSHRASKWQSWASTLGGSPCSKTMFFTTPFLQCNYDPWKKLALLIVFVILLDYPDNLLSLQKEEFLNFTQGKNG